LWGGAEGVVAVARAKRDWGELSLYSIFEAIWCAVRENWYVVEADSIDIGTWRQRWRYCSPACVAPPDAFEL
jgi:hypothetical protein